MFSSVWDICSMFSNVLHISQLLAAVCRGMGANLITSQWNTSARIHTHFIQAQSGFQSPCCHSLVLSRLTKTRLCYTVPILSFVKNREKDVFLFTCDWNIHTHNQKTHQIRCRTVRTNILGEWMSVGENERWSVMGQSDGLLTLRIRERTGWVICVGWSWELRHP